MNGGRLVAAMLARHGVDSIFTLCGGHISPILVEAKRAGLDVVDVRHEVDAVFAADAVGRLTGTPGVAAVTAGPGATNTITAVKNAQLAQSPVVILGGATATVLEGRGSLQDIDQMALFRPHVKWLAAVKRVRDLAPALDEALAVCRQGVPGPVFLECPLDLLYEEEVVRDWYGIKSAADGSWRSRLLSLYLERHLKRIFRQGKASPEGTPTRSTPEVASAGEVRRAGAMIAAAKRPVLLVGSQSTLEPDRVARLARAVGQLGLPSYLSGMARGLLGRSHPLQLRHQRRKALAEADLVLLAGVPCDFRLDYGRQISSRAKLIGANRSRRDLRLNRKPSLGVLADPGRFLEQLAERPPASAESRSSWMETLRGGTRNGRRISIAAPRSVARGSTRCGFFERWIDVLRMTRFWWRTEVILSPPPPTRSLLVVL